MRTRLIIGPIIVLVVLGLLGVDAALFPETQPAISSLLVLLAALGWWEFSAMVGLGPGGERASLGLRLLGLLAVLLFHAVAWVGDVEAWNISHGEMVQAGVFVVVLGAFSLAVFRREFLRHYRGVHETIVGTLLLGLLFSYVLRIYQGEPGGWRVAILFFLGIKGTDIVAYLVGRAIGRHRFLAVSPKKSLEGSLGAVVWGAAWFALAPQWLVPGLFGWLEGILSGIILSVTAQIGDYTESLVKREYDTKDSAALLPEFGGVLDMIDSLVFTGFLFHAWVVLAGS